MLLHYRYQNEQLLSPEERDVQPDELRTNWQPSLRGILSRCHINPSPQHRINPRVCNNLLDAWFPLHCSSKATSPPLCNRQTLVWRSNLTIILSDATLHRFSYGKNGVGTCRNARAHRHTSMWAEFSEPRIRLTSQVCNAASLLQHRNAPSLAAMAATGSFLPRLPSHLSSTYILHSLSSENIPESDISSFLHHWKSMTQGWDAVEGRSYSLEPLILLFWSTQDLSLDLCLLYIFILSERKSTRYWTSLIWEGRYTLDTLPPFAELDFTPPPRSVSTNRCILCPISISLIYSDPKISIWS